MREFEYFVLMARKKPDDLPCAAVIGEQKYFSFPHPNERVKFLIETGADYLTIEKRFEYIELPFEE